MGFFIDVIKNASMILPEVPKPQKKLSLTMRLVWTALALAIYFIMAEIPLYGVGKPGQDPLAYSRIIFASNQGTLMELGIGPIVTAGLITQLLKGANIIKLDFTKPEDRALFTSATKLLTMIVILIQALGYMLGGVYGRNLSFTVMSIIVIQLFSASVMVMLLDELVQKGWGIGSGISLFIMAGVAQRIMWDLISPLTVNVGSETSPKIEPFGFFPFLIDALLRGSFNEVIFRGVFPSLIGFIVTIAVILLLIYAEGVRVEVPITSSKYKGFAGVYPIKLLYVSVVPVILVSVLLTDLIFFSQFIWTNYNQMNTNPWLSWIGTGTVDQLTGNVVYPTGGLAYYMTSPRSLSGAMSDPFRALAYVFFFVLLVVIFSKLWVEIGGLAPKEVAKSLMDADVQVPGFRKAEASIGTVLAKYIPPITILGGIIIGLLASLSDLLGVFGSGTGILLMIGIIMQYYQILVREQFETMLPRLAGILGRR
ncbi:MAG: preprotein translocase subunit SecY [archaeon]|nr:preprotein translocase subunit SecY [archaeon]